MNGAAPHERSADRTTQRNGARDQLDTVAESLHDTHPAIAGMLRDAKADLTALADFPRGTGQRPCPRTRSSD